MCFVMRVCYIFPAFLVGAFFFIAVMAKRPSNARYYAVINNDNYMPIFMGNDSLKEGDYIRFHARIWADVSKDDYDVIQIGYLDPTKKLTFEHGGGTFKPKYPFWFDRANYSMCLRIVHRLQERKIIVTGKLYGEKGYKDLGVFQEPVEFTYEDPGSYLDFVYAIGNEEAGQPHYFYVQGERLFRYDHMVVPTTRYGEQPKMKWFPKNVVEAYRNHIGRTTPFHGDLDELVVESMGYPMPYFATFKPGGFYLGQRAHFAGFFSGQVVAHISTPYTKHQFIINGSRVTYNNVTKIVKANYYRDSTWSFIGSISFLNLGKALAILYNVPHRFNYMSLLKADFTDRVVQFDVQWDGEITEIALFDEIDDQKQQSNAHNYYYRTTTYLHHVDIDNELVKPEPNQ